MIGGTSAVAPLWAGLIALVDERLGTGAGFVNPALYAHGVLRDIATGDNGAYRAKADAWDACTGLGSPDGAKVLAAPAALAAASRLTACDLHSTPMRWSTATASPAHRRAVGAVV